MQKLLPFKMGKLTWFFIAITFFFLSDCCFNKRKPKAENKAQSCGSVAESESEAKAYLETVYERYLSSFCNRATIAEWNYKTNLTSEEAKAAASEAAIAYANFQFKAWNDTIRHWDWESFTDAQIKRQLKLINAEAVAALTYADMGRYTYILDEMSKVYGTAQICPFNNQNCDLAMEGLNLEPEIKHIISTSRDSAELAYTWKAWRDASGKPIRNMYTEFIDLSNQPGNETSELWLLRYESENFKDQMKVIWDDVKELYQKLYGYVRNRLRQLYHHDFVNEDDPIPAHLLGNMWSQNWGNVYEIVKPFPSVPGFDVTDALQKKFGQSGEAPVREMFKLANKFFMDLGLANMSMSFDEKAVIVRPVDREIVCQASAWNFCDGKDYRVKMCTNVAHQDFLTVHHELGHIQYCIQYNKLPITYRKGGNPGFHEAIGDVISLSVATTKHMIKLGLMDDAESSSELTVNYLMKMALHKIAFLPFGYLIDAYRWQLLDGTLPTANFTQGWLRIRNEIQGLVPPVVRSEDDFDPGAKFHVAANIPYIRYFVSFILQFQVHKALCIAANQYVPGDDTKPLHNCDIDGNPAAGQIMKELLAAGASANWQDILEKATGSRIMDAGAIKEYFVPLIEYLDEQQAKLNYSVTWRENAWMEKYAP